MTLAVSIAAFNALVAFVLCRPVPRSPFAVRDELLAQLTR